jgi:hypothetical protein
VRFFGMKNLNFFYILLIFCSSSFLISCIHCTTYISCTTVVCLNKSVLHTWKAAAKRKNE